MFDPTIAHFKSSNINEDMKLIRGFSQTSLDQQVTSPGQMSQLAQILKSRNARYKYNEQAKSNANQWIKSKGTDIYPLLERIKILKTNQEKIEMRRKSEIDCEFYLSDISYSNQKEYIRKNFQFGILSAMQAAMSHQKYRPSLACRLFQQRKQNNERNISKKNDPLVLNIYSRIKEKQQKYIECTRDVIESLPLAVDGSQLHSDRWIQHYQSKIKEYFWNILASQHKNALDSKGKELVAMCIASLKMMESEYQRNLPSGYENMLHYLGNKYLNRIDGKQYIKDGKYGAIWGIAYLLFQAGRRQQFYDAIKSPELRQDFQKADEAIDALNPVKIDRSLDQHDIFLFQLTYALQGVPKYASSVLCDIESPDIAWIFIRNAGIFGDKKYFESLRSQLYENYCGTFLNQVKVKNLLYLLGYSEVMELGVNDIMDEDDYLHFLIAIYYTPIFRHMIPELKQPQLQKKLTAQLVNYIHELLLQKNKHSYNYMILIPNSMIVNELSSIIVYSELFSENFQWQFFKKYLPSDIYQLLVNQTLIKFVDFSHQYLKAAKQQCKLLNNNQMAIQFIIDMNMQAILESNIQYDELIKAEYVIEQIFRRNQYLKHEYSLLFVFFRENRELCKRIYSRNQYQIQSYLRKCEYFLISDQITTETRRTLDKLRARKSNGLQCYMTYIRNTIRASEIALIKLNRLSELRAVQQTIYNALSTLLKTQPYCSSTAKNSGRQILTMLQEALFQRDTP